jgi:hypothetical protein
MPYIQFIGAAVDPCTVILLTHLDALPMVNVAPYAITTNPGGYSIDTSVKKFGTGAFGGGSSGAQHRIDFTGEPGGGVECANGAFQIEHWYQRTGGTGAASAGNQWKHSWYLEFDDGTWVQCDISNAFYFSAPNYRRTLLISVSSSVTGYDEYRTADIDFLPDDNFHAIRFAMNGAGDFAMLVDGAVVASGTLSATVPAGARIVDMAWGDVRTGQRMDEARVMLGRAELEAYTPATGPWVDATCDSEVDEPETDPEWANVVLLVRGTSGFADLSSNAITPTTIGTPTSEAQSGWHNPEVLRFVRANTSAVSYSKPGGFLSASTDDVTIEMFVQIDNLAYNVGDADNLKSFLRLTSGGTVSFRYFVAGSSPNQLGVAVPGQLATGDVGLTTRKHIAYCRAASPASGYKSQIWVDGVRQTAISSTSWPGDWNFDLVQFGVAVLNSSQNNAQGYAEELRITRGARYDGATITVPTTLFPAE